VEILKSSKLAAADKANPAHGQVYHSSSSIPYSLLLTIQQDIGKQFKSATAAISKMLAAAKQGAVGEVMSDSAVEQISKAISDIEVN
jgi:hypothetical protein